MKTAAERARVQISGSHVIHEAVEDEVIVVNLDSGEYYGLRETAAEIWGLLGNHTSVDAIVDAMARRYGAARDAVLVAVEAFLGQLAGEALVVCEGVGAAPGLASEGISFMSLPFSLPRFDKFTDLKHLLAS